MLGLVVVARLSGYQLLWSEDSTSRERLAV